ncbi:sigma-54-dependent Fis family transcriptional regulator, partial [bacterium]|nr:sigma-54-dependent Fis family transcriptional regulator [bacterium]
MALILIVDDEKNMRRVLAANLARDGHETMEAASGRDALVECAGQTPDCVLTDLKMPDMDGMDLLAHLNAQDPHLPVVMLTAHGTVQTAVEAMKRGAFDYLTKPFDTDELLQTVRRAVETRRLDDREPAESVDTADLTANEAMRKLYALADKVADSPTTVLITGESGTGKEVLARKKKKKSGRVDKPY